MKGGNGVRVSERNYAFAGTANKFFGVRRLGAAFVLDGLPSRPFVFLLRVKPAIQNDFRLRCRLCTGCKVLDLPHAKFAKFAKF